MAGRFDNQQLNKLSSAIDHVTQGIVNTADLHNEIHKGGMNLAEFDLGTLAASANQDYAFTSGSNKYNHIKNFTLTAKEATIDMEILRGTSSAPLDISSYGSAVITPRNLSDLSTVPVLSQIRYNSVAYSSANSGQIWMRARVPGSTGFKASYAESMSVNNEELVTKSDTDYVVRFENKSPTVQGTKIFGRLLWYESSVSA